MLYCMSDESSGPASGPERPPRPLGRAPASADASAGRQGRRLGARTYLLGALIIFGLPLLGGGAVWWLYAQKAAVNRAFTQPVREFKGHTSWVWPVAFGPDGRRALSGSEDKTIRIWEVETGQCLRTFTGLTSYIRSVAFSPDGRRALSGGRDGTLRLWNLAREDLERATPRTDDPIAPPVETSQTVRELKGHTGRVLSVAFGPDGRRALSGSRDHTLRLWDIETGAEVRIFEGYTNAVCPVAVSPDGRRALSGGGDGTLRLWNLETGAEVREFTGHTGWVNSVAIGPDGRHAV